MTDSTTVPRAAQNPPAAAPHRATLPVVLAGVFLAGLDFFVVNVAVPAVQLDLHATDAQIQLIVAAYALMYGVGLISGGRLGDLYGRRRILGLGVALFTLASVACGAAPTVELLIAGRIAQGAAAALMAPQVLGIITTAYHGPARTRAVTWYAAASGIAAVFGQLIGGLLIRTDLLGLGWRACFLVNLPIGLAATVLTARVLPESRAPGRPRLDPVGLVLVTAALTAVCLPLIEGRERGWPLWTWLALAAAPVLFALFAAQQRRLLRTGGSPTLDLSLLRERAFAAGLAAQLTFWASMASYFLVFALYLQQGRHLAPLASGLVFTVLGVGYVLASTTARHLAARLGRHTITLGCALRATGLLLELWAVTGIGHTGTLWWLVPGLFLDGCGMGLSFAPLATTVLARVPAASAGSAAGILTTGLQVGNALGVALIGLVFYRVLAAHPGPDAHPAAFRACLLFVLGATALLALVVQALPATTEKD
ncbi:MFS transporter [Streptomyces sp. TLI_171]|uniref:MFS transporter n=1 Tax=Streptomyces sp. TLI_171 TaxID=1938859 RepID=UPI000C185109|nr:MFS transporter [Streptomyces sp. TLI_171]RKE23035.1 MFS transporter [Streptomyces sp. TLI_171]